MFRYAFNYWEFLSTVHWVKLFVLIFPQTTTTGNQKAESNKGAQLWQSCSTRGCLWLPVLEELSSIWKLAGFAFLVSETWGEQNLPQIPISLSSQWDSNMLLPVPLEWIPSLSTDRHTSGLMTSLITIHTHRIFMNYMHYMHEHKHALMYYMYYKTIELEAIPVELCQDFARKSKCKDRSSSWNQWELLQGLQREPIRLPVGSPD